MASVHRTQGADDDLLDIYLFGVERFGPTQAARYLEELETCFHLIAENPRLGRKADRIAKNLRRHEHGSHIVMYYIVDDGVDDGIEVAAVVHKSSIRGLRF